MLDYSNNIKNLGVIGTVGSTSLYFNKPVHNMEDIEGLAIRGSGGLVDEAISLVGASPTFLSTAEQYMALQTGTVDGVMTNQTSYDALNLYEVAPYWLNLDVVRSPYFLLMNNQTWESLSDDHHQIIIDATEEAKEWFFEENAVIEEEVRQSARENIDEEYELPEDELQLWRDGMEDLHDSYLENNGEKGQELMDILGKYRED